jgi:superfamily II DNA/RNA helicase
MTETEQVAFSSLPLSSELHEGLDAYGFANATPIQSQVIPAALNGKDILGCAQTGTGKTAAFLIPVVEKCLRQRGKGIQCIVIAPTRELAIQIEQNLMGLLYFTDLSSQAIYGGQNSGDFVQQKTAVQEGADIIIATPGRLLQHINLGYVDLSTIHTFVLDEADRMLDMGFIGDITNIHRKLTNPNLQTLMFSATMAASIRQLAMKTLKDPLQVNLAIAKPAAGINQRAFMVYDTNKPKLLEHVIKESEIKSMIIFASRINDVNDLYQTLKKLDLKLTMKAMHSGKSQDERNEVMRKFKAGQIHILVATDILSRGVDVDDLSHVVNYDIPDDPADYVHRIGRTARAGKSGAAITFINDKQQFRFYNIEQLIERTIEKELTPEEIGESPVYDPNKPKKKKRKKKRSFNNKRKPQQNKPRSEGDQAKKPRPGKPRPPKKRTNDESQS